MGRSALEFLCARGAGGAESGLFPESISDGFSFLLSRRQRRRLATVSVSTHPLGGILPDTLGPATILVPCPPQPAAEPTCHFKKHLPVLIPRVQTGSTGEWTLARCSICCPALALPGASSHLSGATVLSPRPRVSPSYVYLEEWVNYPSHLPHTLSGALCAGK